ncbi:flagellar M-ring protein FliF C-terminal domain-containing protein, partial [Alloalcanivorax marinus]|uniref:flagellar M-ring protein FliF C-terminal domain-containing protein n=1 Tax=Alloalcanivorax marinus TaxID=1177169 RepID=UPI0021D3EFFA
PAGEPLEPEQLERIRQLVRQAMGFSEERGDGLEVVNSPFTKDVDTLGRQDWWRDPFWQTLLLSLGRWLLVGLAALLLFLFVVRPLLRRFLEQRPTQRPATAAPAPVAAAPYAARPDADGADQNMDAEPPPRRRRRQNGAHEQNLKDLQEMAQEDPAMVAMIVRSWMNRHD